MYVVTSITSSWTESEANVSEMSFSPTDFKNRSELGILEIHETLVFAKN